MDGSNGELDIFNVLGQKVFTTKIYETGTYEFSPAVNSGIYIVTFVSGGQHFTQKLFIGRK